MPFGSNIVSPTHLLLVLVVVMLVFGTKKLPELGRGIGSAMREFKDSVSAPAAEPTHMLTPAPAMSPEGEPAQRVSTRESADEVAK